MIPNQVIFRQITDQSPLVFAIRHLHFNEIEKILRIGGHNMMQDKRKRAKKESGERKRE